MQENLAMQIASRRVSRYRDDVDALIADHREAMDCRDCEEFLRKGIDAYRWMTTAEQIVREADYEGLHPLDAATRREIDDMFALWLKTAGHALGWIEKVSQRGYQIDNLEEFREIHDLAAENAKRKSWGRMAANSFQRRQTAESW